MNRFSLVGLTGMFTSNTFTGLVISVGWIKMSLSIWQKFLFPVPLCCILLTSTITNLFMLFKSTVKPWLSVPRLSGLFDYLDLFPWSWFFSWILVRCDLEKLKWFKSSLILPNVCLEHCFNMFLFEKARVVRAEQLFWCIQLNSDWLNIVILLLKGKVMLDSTLVM